MKPWVHRYKTKNELRRSGTTARVFISAVSSAAPSGFIARMGVLLNFNGRVVKWEWGVWWCVIDLWED